MKDRGNLPHVTLDGLRKGQVLPLLLILHLLGLLKLNENLSEMTLLGKDGRDMDIIK